MRQLLVYASFVLIALWQPPLFAQDLPSNQTVTHGTINVVLANKNGIVVLTDSMLTRGSGPGAHHEATGQKLFRIDDKTVCAIAGFISKEPASDFIVHSSEVFDTFSAGLKNNDQIGMEDKLKTLTSLFSFRLQSAAEVDLAQNASEDTSGYRVELTIAGYNLDGVPKVGHTTISIVRDGDQPSAVLQNIYLTPVEPQLVRFLYGEPLIADALLQFPLGPEDNILDQLAASLKADRGASFTTDQMVKVAEALAAYTSKIYPSVGGKNQVAVLSDGKISRFDQEHFGAPPPADFSFVIANWGMGTDQFPLSGSIFFLKNGFIKVPVIIDNNYFMGNTFRDSIVVLNGRPREFATNNTVDNCTLILGPNSKLNDRLVKQILHQFAWKSVIHSPKLPSIQDLYKELNE